MPPKVNWTWRPDAAKRKLYEEWRKITIGYLVSSREGSGVRGIANYLVEHTGETIPLDKMGFRTIQQFLFEMRDDIEVRLHDGKLFIFIREDAIPQNMRNIRDLVLGQAKDKGSKRGGVIKRPTKAQSSYCSPEDLFLPWQELASRAPTTFSSGAGASSSGSSRFPSARAPRRPFRIQGLILSDDDSESDDGFDFYAGPASGKDKVTYSTTKVTVVKMEPKKAEPTPEVIASTSTAPHTSLSDKADGKSHVRKRFGSWTSSEDESDINPTMTAGDGSKSEDLPKPPENLDQVEAVTLASASEVKSQDDVGESSNVSVKAPEPVQYIRKKFGEWSSDESECDDKPMEVEEQPQSDAETEQKGIAVPSEFYSTQDEVVTAYLRQFPDLDFESDESIDAFIELLDRIGYEYPGTVILVNDD